jgi:uncharacterized SAM-binding protein YcdF (DUF218 family)
MTYTQPLILCFCVLALIGLARMRRCRGVWLPVVAVTALVLLAWPPVALLLSRPLEARYPIRPFKANPNYDAIVVFSSTISPPVFERPYPLPDSDMLNRLLYTAWVYKQRPVPVLACGGRGKHSDQPYSVVMRDLLVKLDVPQSMIWTEEQSSSTHENAAYGAQILKQHNVTRVALIVEAASMPRAAGCLTKEGILTIPAPSDFYEPQEIFMPTWKAIRQNETTLHETLGLIWYRLRGWI